MATPAPMPALALVRAVPAHPYRAPAAQELTVSDVASLAESLREIRQTLGQVHSTVVDLAVKSGGYAIHITALVDGLREERAARERAEARIAVLEKATAGASGAGRVAAWLVPILVSIVAIAVAVLRR